MMPLFVTIKETGADGSASLAGVASCSVQFPQAGQNGFATSLGCNKGRKCHTGGMGGVRSQRSERGMGLRLPGFSHLHFQSYPLILELQKAMVCRELQLWQGQPENVLEQGRIGQETASYVHQSTNCPPETSCPPMGQAEGIQASQPSQPTEPTE